MKVSKKVLWETSGPLARLVEIEFEEEKLNYKLGRISEAASSVLKPIQKSHDKLVKKHGTEIKKPDGSPTGQFYVTSDTPEDELFQAEMDAILAEGGEIQLPAEVDYKRITLTDLKPYMKRIKARDLGALSTWLIEPMNEE